jgi:hypothetical protein
MLCPICIIMAKKMCISLQLGLEAMSIYCHDKNKFIMRKHCSCIDIMQMLHMVNACDPNFWYVRDFWFVMLCSVVGYHFRGLCCLYLQGEVTSPWSWRWLGLPNVFILPQHRRSRLESSLPWKPQILWTFKSACPYLLPLLHWLLS